MALDEAEVGDEHLDQRLAHFFEQARPYFHRQSDEELPEPYVDFERLACFLGRLRVPLDSAEAGACSNPWLTAGLGHDEVRISGVLAALWDRRLHGDEGRAFLARFLHSAGSDFPDESELSYGYRVQTEHCLNGDGANQWTLRSKRDHQLWAWR